jgi:SH3 domain protein
MMFKLAVKTATVALIAIICMATASIGATKYVAEEFEITMRTGPGPNNKIIALIPSGRQVEVLTPGDEWTEVQTSSGKQGWVLSRYLTDDLPSELKLERLEKKYDELVSRNKDLDQSASQLGNAKKELGAELADTKSRLTELTAAHEALMKESADVIKLKKNYETTVKELTETRSRAEKAENELNRLSNSQVYQGMLYGGGLLAAGFIVGFIVKKPKRRSQLL